MLLLHYLTAEKVAAATRVFGTAVQKSLHAAGLAPEALKIVPVGRVWSACIDQCRREDPF
jgi:hypothetical protein